MQSDLFTVSIKSGFDDVVNAQNQGGQYKLEANKATTSTIAFNKQTPQSILLPHTQSLLQPSTWGFERNSVGIKKNQSGKFKEQVLQTSSQNENLGTFINIVKEQIRGNKFLFQVPTKPFEQDYFYLSNQNDYVPEKFKLIYKNKLEKKKLSGLQPNDSQNLKSVEKFITDREKNNFNFRSSQEKNDTISRVSRSYPKSQALQPRSNKFSKSLLKASRTKRPYHPFQQIVPKPTSKPSLKI